MSSENEDIVRTEAIILIHCLHLSKRCGNDDILKVYQIMVTAATIDLSCDVKKKALKFWDTVIWDCLENEGMVDGQFPEFTFSKEHRKITALNSEEIRKRLNKVINKLKTIGCLQVLMKTIQDDPDLEVVETSIQITNKFAKLLIKYNMSKFKNEKIVYKDFYELISHNLDAVLEQRKTWRKTTNTFEVLLNNILEDLDPALG